MLGFGRNGESSDGVLKARHVHWLDVLWYLEQHVRARHPHTRRTLEAETMEGVHETIDVGSHFSPLEVDRVVAWLVG